MSNRSRQTLAANDGYNTFVLYVKPGCVLTGGVLGRPEKPPKSALAERLREVRRRAGDLDREAFAKQWGIAPSTLANYERGDRVPDADFLALYRERLGVDLDWLLFGTGTPPQVASVQPGVASEVLKRVGEIVSRAHADAGIKLPMGALMETIAEAYNDFTRFCPNPTDAPADVVDAMLGVVESRLRTRLQDARDNPGTGKRLA